MTRTISSQRYLDDAIVAAKREAGDYSVSVYPVAVDGDEYLVVVDGHHSLAAAVADGATPAYREVTGQMRREYDHQLAELGAAEWLAAHRHDSDYYDVATGADVW